MSEQEITIIGGGLAGCEAAWQIAQRGISVRLHEMKPDQYSPAHSMQSLAELVCSNSLRSDDPNSAVGLLKEEMRRLDSLLMEAAEITKVPAGKALAVDRVRFADWITERMEQHEKITICRGEIQEIPEPGEAPIILATGPLTSAPLAASLAKLTGDEHLAFYDAIAPIVNAESLNRDIIFQASRYDDGPGDYLNCPMSEEEYTNFINAMKEAKTVPLKSFEEQKYFEGCLPIEVMVSRGDDTPRFGPMKPVGLPDPRTGEDAYAVVQLRKENVEGSQYNMVGFQTKLTYPEQKRIFRMIPGMENAEFDRLGSIHRNTFICAPKILRPTLQCDKRPDLLLAGQLTGVEGYVESTAMGLLAGINAARLALGQEPAVPPADTALGALTRHLTNTETKHFQPSNVNFGLFPPIGKKMPKRMRGEYRATQAQESLAKWIQDAEITNR